MNEFLYGILTWINSWVGNYGWTMVVFTLMVRLVLTPFDFKSRVSMRKTTKLQPQLTALQKKYANDKEKLNAKTAELYKKEHINPLSSCLPLLLTWPVLIAVFGAMRMVANGMMLSQITDILQGKEPQMEAWLWVKNLWMPDSLFSPAYPDKSALQQISSDLWVAWFNGTPVSGKLLTEVDVPALLNSFGLEFTADSFTMSNLSNTVTALETTMLNVNPTYAAGVSTAPGWTFNLLITSVSLMKDYNGLMLLPILSAVTQIIMTKVTGAGQQQQPQQEGQPNTGKFMTWFFPIFSLVICFGYSSAFALYWVAGNVISMAQTLIINRILDEKEKKAAISATAGVK